MAGTWVFIGLGSNLQEPQRQLQMAIEALRGLALNDSLQISPLYRSPPMGPADQPEYLNAVARLQTKLSAEALLGALQAIENRQGRVRDGQRWGPRTLDLDLLLYGDAVINQPDLQVPHPGIAERAFVLQPLHDIAPQLDIPGKGTVSACLARVDCQGLLRLAAA